MKTFLIVCLVIVVYWALYYGISFLFPPKKASKKPKGLQEVYTMKSCLAELCNDYGTSSLKGLKRIFEFERKMNLIAYDDTTAQKLQIYETGGNKTFRWTVLLPLRKDQCGERFHPLFQFNAALDDCEFNSVYTGIDYRTLYGKKVAFTNLPWEVKVFILKTIDAPILDDYTPDTKG